MACTARLGGDGLTCVRADDHNNGHVYYSTSGMAHHKHEDDGGDS